MATRLGGNIISPSQGSGFSFLTAGCYPFLSLRGIVVMFDLQVWYTWPLYPAQPNPCIFKKLMPIHCLLPKLN